jgi:hypothetical protein
MVYTGSTMKGTFLFRILSSQNNTMIGELLGNHSATVADAEKPQDYDSSGAAYYILAVIFMYGCSIVMMIGSFVKKKSSPDHSGVKYMKDLQTLEKLQLQQEKFRTKLQMHQKKVHRILGPDRAEVLDESGSPSPTAPLSPTDPAAAAASAASATFLWEEHGGAGEWGDDRRPSGSSVATTIVCSDDLHSADLPYNRYWMAGTGGYEENGRLSAPNSPTVPHKSFPDGRRSGSPESDLNPGVAVICTPTELNACLAISDEETKPPIYYLPKSQSCGDIVRSYSHTKLYDIPEVRIHTCD